MEFPLKFYGEINQNDSVKMYYNSCDVLDKFAQHIQIPYRKKQEQLESILATSEHLLMVS